MSYQLTGKIKVINDTQTFASGFTKREFVVTTNEQYAQDIRLAFVKDKCLILDGYKVGQDVIVDFNLRGNESNGRYFVDLNAWRIGSNSTDGVEVITQAAKDKAAPTVTDVGEDDLPF